MSERRFRLRFYINKDGHKNGEKDLETISFPDNMVINGGESAKLEVYVINTEPHDYQVFNTTHDNKEDVTVTLETDENGILKARGEKSYKLTLIWHPPKGNTEALTGSLIIEGRFIVKP